MDRKKLEELLRAVAAGEVPVEDAVARLRHLPYEDLGFARVDTHRTLRTGLPEAIYCEGKTPAQSAAIAARLAATGAPVLATRADAATFEAIREQCPAATYHEEARLVVVAGETADRAGRVIVLSAGTADRPVAEEAALTAETVGCRVERVYDVGVAGLHRLLDQVEAIQQADCLVVVAGMEGALASVVAGLAGGPVIAVPTSVGYGASFGGLAPLLTMLNSCAGGVLVVNIDNGFGAGYAAALIARRAREDL
ncbi:MAG: nickel pincer cofactor biosynthesis protein LarB [Candidatus Coatesbacteria bacterium]|nr:MAG: nickel pincer cofactor biosynthesis protein LarB [Candidatus Coatesbacteria bacterium]